uniref:LysM peptidoglycan-binding domain-containing protein n=1 Tax=Indiicoccus explosivorum TaxID=1917864 RepID=UPI0011861075
MGSAGMAVQAETVTIEPGDTFWGISQETGISVDRLMELNSQYDPYALPIGGELVISKESGSPTEKFHTIQPGETLISIANLHEGVTLDELYE